jgi:alkylhydroperoxidase/carboxymuconolactone decarboxylase family protein YurZ
MIKLDAGEIDRLLAQSPLSESDAALVLLFAAAVDAPESANVVLERLAARPHPATADLLEMIFQLPLFAGFPRTINTLASFRRHFGFEAESAPSRRREEDLSTLRERGHALFAKIYAGNTERVLADLDHLHSELKDWILTDAYGLILSREALNPRLRELAACAALVVSGDLRQLSSHARGALHCGGSREEIEAALALCAPLVRPAVLEEAERLLP